MNYKTLQLCFCFVETAVSVTSCIILFIAHVRGAYDINKSDECIDWGMGVGGNGLHGLEVAVWKHRKGLQ